jgi:hypothetical protein
VKERGKGTNNIRSIGNSTFKQQALREAETFFRLTQRQMMLRKVTKETKRSNYCNICIRNSCNICIRSDAINNGNNNDGKSFTLLYSIYRMASLPVNSPTRAF